MECGLRSGLKVYDEASLLTQDEVIKVGSNDLDKGNVECVLNKIGVSTRINDNPRSTNEVIEDLAALWDVTTTEDKENLFVSMGLL